MCESFCDYICGELRVCKGTMCINERCISLVLRYSVDNKSGVILILGSLFVSILIFKIKVLSFCLLPSCSVVYQKPTAGRSYVSDISYKFSELREQ